MRSLSVVHASWIAYGINKKAAKAIVRKTGKHQLQREVTRIAKDYFRDATDALELSLVPSSAKCWWQVGLYSAVIAANVAMLFAASAPAIVVKLALPTPAGTDLVAKGTTADAIDA